MRRVLIIISLLAPVLLHAQSVVFSGTVSGYEGKSVLLNKTSIQDLRFTGALDGVTITYKVDGEVVSTKTDVTGTFQIRLPKGSNNRITFSKSGYSTITMDFNVGGISGPESFAQAQLLLKQVDHASVFAGSIRVSDSGSFEFKSGAEVDDKELRNLQKSNESLLSSAVEINNSGMIGHGATVERDPVDTPDEGGTADTTTTELLTFTPILDEASTMEVIDPSNINSWQLAVDSARYVLGTLDTNSAEYKILLNQIVMAEEKIKDTQTIIDLQERELSASRNVILFISLFAVVLLALAGVLFFFLRQRKLLTTQLEERNSRISKINSDVMSSIRYAALIQTSFMRPPEELRGLYPDSFIYNEPKDIVSGDFYWFGIKDGWRIVVAADCTGHGVPGAMLTVLGFSALNDIVNVKGETDPAQIVRSLNHVIVETFETKDEYTVHGMDVTVVCAKEGSGEVVVSGATNGVFLRNEEGIKHHDVSPYSLGNEIEDELITSVKLKLKKGDTIFLFTDGYHDQFKGNTSKIEKFNIPRFEELLTSIADQDELRSGPAVLSETLLDWRADRAQLDDVLVIGLRV